MYPTQQSTTPNCVYVETIYSSWEYFIPRKYNSSYCLAIVVECIKRCKDSTVYAPRYWLEATIRIPENARYCNIN